ncbi:MAG: hypothetical protein LBT93_07595 [Treponema sp.]|jgi:hypothetical protein|nr:hypothetical protein [Treponema sp.]
MFRFFHRVLIFLLAFAGGASVFAADIAPFTLTSSRIYALGGPHTAYTHDITTLAVNPAALRGVKKQFNLGEIGIGTHGDIISLIPLIRSVAGGSFDDFDSSKIADLTSGSDGKIPLGFEFRGPLSVGYMNNGIGFGFFDRIYFDTRFIGTALRLYANADFLLNGGYAYRIVDKGSHVLDAGIVVKAFGRYSFGINGSVLDMVANSDTLIDDSPMDLILGGGFDLGVLYHLGEGFTFGLTGNDVFSMGLIRHLNGADSGSSEIGYIKPKVNFGAAYSFTPWKFAAFSLMLDYRDVVNIFTNDYTTRNPILNIGFGAEAQIIQFIYARVGVNDMLPAVGIGFDIKVLKIDAALYGKELSHEPGGMSTYALDLSLTFSL